MTTQSGLPSAQDSLESQAKPGSATWSKAQGPAQPIITQQQEVTKADNRLKHAANRKPPQQKWIREQPVTYAEENEEGDVEAKALVIYASCFDQSVFVWKYQLADGDALYRNGWWFREDDEDIVGR